MIFCYLRSIIPARYAAKLIPRRISTLASFLCFLRFAFRVSLSLHVPRRANLLIGSRIEQNGSRTSHFKRSEEVRKSRLTIV